MSTATTIATQLGLALKPLREAIDSDANFITFANRLGFRVTGMPPSYVPLKDLLDSLIAIAEGADPSLDDLKKAIKDVNDLLTTGLKAPDGTDDTGTPGIGQRLLELLLADYLAAAFPTVYRVFRAIGLITMTEQPATATQPSFVETSFDFDAIPHFLTSPAEIVKAFFAWGAADYAFWLIAEWLAEFLHARGLRVQLHAPDPDAMDGFLGDGDLDNERVALTAAFMDGIVDGAFLELGFRLMNLPGTDPGFILQPLIPEEKTIPLAADFSIEAKTNVADLFGILVSPLSGLTVKYPFAPGNTTAPTASVNLLFSPANPRVLLGDAGATRLELKGAKAGVGIDASNGLDVSVEASTIGMQAVVQGGDGDGFVAKLLGGETITVPLSVGLRWSVQKGFSFSGSGKFDITLTPNLELGPVVISKIDVAVSGTPSTPPPNPQPMVLTTTVGLGVEASIGPVDVDVDQVGVALNFRNTPGNLGPYDLDVGFKFPTGVGISVDAGSVSGGGFLFFDEPNGRYGGALELSAYDIAIKAFGLIETKVPGVAFSFVIVISAEFTPIQLGFGFTLDGVGGLIGINRTVDSTTLAARVRDGTLDNILFPHNLIQNAPAIISELASLFPAAEAHFTFGPLAKLGWIGLVHGTLGLILELPSKAITIIGNINAILPKPDDAIVVLDMDIGGKLDFPKKHFELDATLSPNSKVGAYTTSGDMAMRLDWGDNPNFAISLGGFHSQFTPPPGFPSLRRLAIDLGIKGNPSVTLQGFMALTSNTAQIGASLDVYASEYGATLTGSIGFEALFVFSPFSFDARMWGGVHVDFEGVGFGLTLDGRIRGPSPWIIDGEVCVSLWIASACVGIHKQLDGAPPPDTLPLLDPWEGSPVGAALSAQDVHGLKPAIVELSNWAGRLPPGAVIGVTYVQRKDQKQPVDPVGIATFRQKSVPLDYDISRFAGRPPSRPGKLQIISVTAGGVNTTSNYVTDFFAPGQYRQMSNDEVLAAKSFEQLNAGVELQGKVATLGSAQARPLTYRTVILDAQGNELPGAGQDHPLPPRHLDGLVGSTSASRLSARLSGRTRFIDITQARQLTAQLETFSLVLKANLSLVGTTTTNIPRSAVAAALDALAGKNTLKRQQYQIIGSYALAAA